MRLLLTRAAEDAIRTQEKLEALGHRVVVSPVIEMAGVGAIWPAGVVDALLATSAHAFSATWVGPSPEVRHVLPLYIVGARTAEMARRHGFLGAAMIATNAPALASAMGTIAGRPRRIVYVAGRNRKPDIEASLDVIDHALEVIEVYEARALDTPSPEALSSLRQGSVDGVLHFSRRSATLFVAAVSRAGLDVGRLAHFCLSDDVAAPLIDEGCATVHVADKPNEADLLALIGPAAEPNR